MTKKFGIFRKNYILKHFLIVYTPKFFLHDQNKDQDSINTDDLPKKLIIKPKSSNTKQLGKKNLLIWICIIAMAFNFWLYKIFNLVETIFDKYGITRELVPQKIGFTHNSCFVIDDNQNSTNLKEKIFDPGPKDIRHYHYLTNHNDWWYWGMIRNGLWNGKGMFYKKQGSFEWSYYGIWANNQMDAKGELTILYKSF